MSSLRKNLLAREGKRFSVGACKDCSPVKWSNYFESQQEVITNNNKYNLYLLGNNGPVLFLIHGGGYSALTWALLSEEIVNKIECRVIAIDLRGHGNTKTTDEEDLSLETLANDVADAVETYFEGEVPPIVVMGHSLGGAVAVAVANLIPNVIGLCVIDVVEGTALESLTSMQNILRGRPLSFKSIEQAIQWNFRSGQTHNLEAARVSMPGQIKNIQTGELAATEIEDVVQENGVHKREMLSRVGSQRSIDSIEEESEKDLESTKGNGILPPCNYPVFKVPSTEEINKYTWRIDLSKTEPFWNGWFKGLSQKFLKTQVPKVLILANIHGLDTVLTVGQMQGKFQLQVLPRSGHAIHEDQPHHVADIVAGFLVKQKLAVAKNGFTPMMPAC